MKCPLPQTSAASAALLLALAACGGPESGALSDGAGDEPGGPVAVSEDALVTPSERVMPVTLSSPLGCLDAAARDFYGYVMPAACSGATSQQWRVHPTGELQSVSTGQCLFYGTGPGATIVGAFLAPCTSTAAVWSLTAAGELRTYGSCLTAQYYRFYGNRSVLTTCDGRASQRWSPSLAPDSSLAASFGYGAYRRSSGHVRQNVPLVRLYVNYLYASSPLAHPVSYYENLIFGAGFPSLNGFLAESSSGLFRWDDAGAFGVFDHPTNGAGCDTGPVLEELIRTYLAGAIDLSRFDTNGDGTVTHGELQFMVVSNCGGRIAGASRPVGCLTNIDSSARHLTVCPDLVTEIEDRVQFATLAHESLHALGGIDIYGWGNFQASTMAATVVPEWGADAQSTIGLDAMHRFWFGWNRPVIQPITAGVPSSGSVSMDGDRNYQSSLLLGSTSRFYLLERKLPSGYDTWGGAAGVAIWQLWPNMFAVRDPVTGNYGSRTYLLPSTGMATLPTDFGGEVAVFATGSEWGSMTIHWRYLAAMNVSVVQNGTSGANNIITATATDPATGVAIRGTVWLDGVQVGTTGTAFSYPVLLQFQCTRSGCYVTNAPRTFEVRAAGYQTTTFVWR